MECVFEKCTTVSDRLITCWLCDGNAHLKCAGLNGRHYDKIVESSSGLRWSCPNCRKIDIDFYRLHKDAKKGFTEIANNLSEILTKFNTFQEMFLKLKWPENMMVSPITKRKKPSTAKVSAANSLDSRDLLGSFLSPSPCVSVKVDTRNSNLVEKDSFPPSAPPSTPSFNVPTTSFNVHSQQTLDSVNCEVVTTNITQHGMFTDTALNSASLSDMKKTTLNNNNNNTINLDYTLNVVPPRKTVFVSRLTPDTVENNIKNFIRVKCPHFNENDCNVFKFSYSQPRDISSFKITVPLKIFDTIIDESFWPQGVLVKEFLPRERQRHGVTITNTTSKN